MNTFIVFTVIGTLLAGIVIGQDDPFGEVEDPFFGLPPPDRDPPRFDRGRVNERARESPFISVSPGCREKVADIFFILDSSRSIYIEDHFTHRTFVRNLVARFDIDNRFTRVGALTYSDNYRVSFDLTSHRSRPDVQSAINDNNIPYLAGLTNTASAIRYVRENVPFREDITRVIVVMTDGYSTEPGSTAAEAERARREGNYIFVIGVGQYTDEREWRAIASDPDSQFMYNISNFRNYDQLQSILASRICALPPIILNRVQTCFVQRNNANVLFVAGASDASTALPVVSTIVDNLQARQGEARMSLQISGCSEGDNVPVGNPNEYCAAGGEQADFLTLLKRLRESARRYNEEIIGNQVAILFVNDATLLEFDRFELYTLVRDIDRDGINLYIVDLGDGNNRELDRLARGNVFVLNDRFNTNPVGRLLTRVCDDFNALPFSFPTRPPV